MSNVLSSREGEVGAGHAQIVISPSTVTTIPPISFSHYDLKFSNALQLLIPLTHVTSTIWDDFTVSPGVAIYLVSVYSIRNTLAWHKGYKRKLKKKNTSQ